MDEVRAIVGRVKLAGPFAEKWFHVGDIGELAHPPRVGTGVIYVQQRYMEPDINTGVMAEQRARVWVVPEDATESQVVQICFGAALASAEHQVREFFTYAMPCERCEGTGETPFRGAVRAGDPTCPDCDGEGTLPRRVFGPHMDIAELAGVAK